MNERELADLFLYVPAGGRKIPLSGWQWSKKCPDGVDPRSEENPWVFTYEQTLDDDVLKKIRGARPYWDGQWIRVGVIDGYEWVDVDVDVTGHDVTIDDPDKIGFNADVVSLMSTENGWHLELVIDEGVLPVRGRHVPGIDYQGTLPGMTGVAGDPFHGSGDYELENVGEVVEHRHQMTLNPGATINYDGDPLMAPVDEEDLVDGSPGSIREFSADLPVDMRAFDLGLEPGERGDHPIHGSSTGANFGIDEGWGTWNCYSGRHDHDCGNVTGNAYHFIAMQEGILECGEWMGEGREAWGGRRDEIAEACERRGVPLPPGWGEYVADLAPHERMERGGDEDLLWEIRGEFTRQARLALDQGRNGHLVGPKAVGKTWNAVRFAEFAPVTVIAPTKKKYDEIIEEAEEAGLDALRLPSFPEHSALYDEWESEYHRGAFPREIYSWEERDVGEDDYKRLQDEDFGDYDILVGAPAHAFVKSVVEDRVVISDDSDLDAYRETFDNSIKAEVNEVLTEVDSRWGNWKQLERDGDWRALRREIISHLERIGAVPDGDVYEVLEARAAEGGDDIDRREFLAQVPSASLNSVDWMRALTGDLHSNGAYEDRGMRLVAADGQRALVRAPDLSPAEQVFTMGAWAAVDELEGMFGDMNVEYEGMFGCTRHGDMERALNRFVIQTSDAVHNKSTKYSEDIETSEKRQRTNPERVRAIARGLRSLGRELGVDEDVEVFSTLAEAEDIEGAVNYAMLTGRNDFGGSHLAVAGASQHFGDHYVNMRAAVAGHAPDEPVRENRWDPGRWESEVHARIDERMRRSGLYEAITRVGREDTGLTIVAADTRELPDWLQVIDQSGRVRRMSRSAEALLNYAKAADEAFQIKNAEGEGAVDALDFSAPQLYEAAEQLLDAGLLAELDETGKWSASRYEAGDELVNRDLIGLKRAELTGSSFNGAANPDWDVETLTPGVGSVIADLELADGDGGTSTWRQSGLLGPAVHAPEAPRGRADVPDPPGEQEELGGWER